MHHEKARGSQGELPALPAGQERGDYEGEGGKGEVEAEGVSYMLGLIHYGSPA